MTGAVPRPGRHRRPCCFCRVHPADVRDRETGRLWCLGCAADLVHAGDPITEWDELDAGSRYGELLSRHGRGLYTAFRTDHRPGSL